MSDTHPWGTKHFSSIKPGVQGGDLKSTDINKRFNGSIQRSE
jgi:hypothetical protein